MSNVATREKQQEIIDALGAMASGGPDRELVVTTYIVKTAFAGASLGDTVTCTQVIDVSGAPSTVSTIWRNQTSGADFGAVPLAANLTLLSSTALTDIQLRAAAIAVTAVDLGTTADAAATSDTGVFSLIALFKRLLRFSGTTREYAAAGYRASFTAAASYLTVASIGLGTSREVRISANANCWLRFATAGTLQDAAVPASNSAATSMRIVADQPEVMRIPTGCTHISLIRESVDGNATFTPVA